MAAANQEVDCLNTNCIQILFSTIRVLLSNHKTGNGEQLLETVNGPIGQTFNIFCRQAELPVSNWPDSFSSFDS